jgi:hypothetical protein
MIIIIRRNGAKTISLPSFVWETYLSQIFYKFEYI